MSFPLHCWAYAWVGNDHKIQACLRKFTGSGFSVQGLRYKIQPSSRPGSAQSDRKNINEHRASNVQSVNCSKRVKGEVCHCPQTRAVTAIQSIRNGRAQRFHPSTFDIRYSTFCGSAVRILDFSLVKFDITIKNQWFRLEPNPNLLTLNPEPLNPEPLDGQSGGAAPGPPQLQLPS